VSIHQDTLEPRFITIMADYDGFARWVAEVRNADTGNVALEVLIVLEEDGSIALATRPSSDCTWSPPIMAIRR